MNTNDKLILSDVDDTVLACSDALEKFCIGILHQPPIRRLRDTYLIHHAFAVDEATSHHLCNLFWNHELIGQLEPEPCARLVLPRLYAAGYRFVAVTACLDEPLIRQRRMANLERAFGFPWEDIYCTYQKEKADVLKLFKPTIWVEDHWHNCQAGGKIGHNSFLLNRAHNAVDLEPPKFTRVDDWHDIERQILY
jgi:5'(3')-deoxyribonucleotidase